jgi:hypothetical protein
MIGKRRCIHCRKTFEWYRSDAQLAERKTLPRFCGHKCRLDHGGTGFIPGGEKRISKLSKLEKLESIKKSFEKDVIRKEGCWDWSGKIAKSGYGAMTLNFQYNIGNAHRASWIIHKGIIPKGKQVCHSCDNRKCTNPEHLWIGTAKDNAQDREIKGRSNNTPPPVKRGSSNGNSSLDESSVVEIKRLLKEGESLAEIARKYGVTKTGIYHIKKGNCWKHIP